MNVVLLLLPVIKNWEGNRNQFKNHVIKFLIRYKYAFKNRSNITFKKKIY